ncbi:MAG: type II secretion system F family protein [Verrucomicrobiota bacterium]|jgi:type IV pilus assembly protein PilC
MPLIVSPRQFAQRAEFYHQLAQCTSAGIGVIRALEQIKAGPPARSFREPLQRLLDKLAEGATLAESLQQLGWLPAFDVALVEAGEQSGRLDACFRLLADYYNERATIARQVIADLIYPVALFHMAIFIFPFAQFFLSGNLLVYLAKTFGVLIPIYLFAGLAIYATQSKHGERWRARSESLLRRIPVLGTARHYLALSRLAAALEALNNAGVNVVAAWDLAAAASGSPALRRAVRAWKPQVAAGQMPSEAVRACRLFPEMFANLYASGEVSGKLDESLRHLHRVYNEDGVRKLHTFAQLTPRLVYLLVALMIAYKVVQFWLGYFNEINNASHF